MKHKGKKLAKKKDTSVKTVVTTALALLAALFVLPMLMLPMDSGDGAAPSPAATGALPLDRTVVTAPPGEDSRHSVRVQVGEGEVLTLTLDKYLWRVVAAEMPASFEPEALKAQTVAARTYTLSKMGRTVESHPDADVCTDIGCCQAYIDPAAAAANWGANAEIYAAKIAAAVADTDGIAALYEGQPIQAVFFSSAAGHTADAVEVWGNAVPYLTGVDSPEGASDVPNYHSSVTLTAEEFKTGFLARYPGADLSGTPAGWFSNWTYGSSGAVSTVDVGGVTLSGTALRTLFALRSAHFTVEAGDTGVTFSVTGYGHGVGLSQYGANTLAKQGKTYEEILKWYYTGIELAPCSPNG